MSNTKTHMGLNHIFTTRSSDSTVSIKAGAEETLAVTGNVTGNVTGHVSGNSFGATIYVYVANTIGTMPVRNFCQGILNISGTGTSNLNFPSIANIKTELLSRYGIGYVDGITWIFSIKNTTDNTITITDTLAEWDTYITGYDTTIATGETNTYRIILMGDGVEIQEGQAISM